MVLEVESDFRRIILRVLHAAPILDVRKEPSKGFQQWIAVTPEGGMLCKS